MTRTRENRFTLNVLNCRYGRMFALASDNVIGRSLRIYGEWAEHELSLLRSFVVEGTTIVDVGAGIGTHTLAFSRWVRDGRVIAIEAQPVISTILWINCVQNSCWNVNVVNAICSEQEGSVRFGLNYTREQNIGGISFASKPLWRQLLAKLRGLSLIHVGVPKLPLDALLCSSEPVTLIKIDIEGMELDALRGAKRVLIRHRPVIFFEQNDAARLIELYDYLTGLGYRLYWMETHPFNQANYRGSDENIWWRTETGILALPEKKQPTNALIEVKRNDRSPPHLLDAREGATVLY
jgi:FkbM family methyltransferase